MCVESCDFVSDRVNQLLYHWDRELWSLKILGDFGASLSSQAILTTLGNEFGFTSVLLPV